jgi:polyisoprenoid-binding protein YceI
MKLLIVPVIGIVLSVGLVIWWWQPTEERLGTEQEPNASEEEGENAAVVASVEVPEGTYTVLTDASIVRWAGQKPLISGYMNEGSLAVTSGSIDVTEAGAVSGSFVIDMQSLSVSETPTKPGQENVLEGHLKSDRWFDVGTYPTAEFVILEATEVPEAGSHTHEVRGTLTMKGETGEITFPATVSLDGNGVLTAQASFEIDRTQWGITAGSGSFFDNLADNVVDDMILISFTLVAE